MRTFFQTLEARRFVTPQTCPHGRARLFHVHYKPLYTAIGDPDNRSRGPMTLAHAIEVDGSDVCTADPFAACPKEAYTNAGYCRGVARVAAQEARLSDLGSLLSIHGSRNAHLKHRPVALPDAPAGQPDLQAVSP